MNTHDTELAIKGTVRVEHRHGEISRVLRPVREANGAIRWVDITHALSADEIAALSEEICGDIINRARGIDLREVNTLAKCVGR